MQQATIEASASRSAGGIFVYLGPAWCVPAPDTLCGGEWHSLQLATAQIAVSAESPQPDFRTSCIPAGRPLACHLHRSHGAVSTLVVKHSQKTHAGQHDITCHLQAACTVWHLEPACLHNLLNTFAADSRLSRLGKAHLMMLVCLPACTVTSMLRHLLLLRAGAHVHILLRADSYGLQQLWLGPPTDVHILLRAAAGSCCTPDPWQSRHACPRPCWPASATAQLLCLRLGGGGGAELRQRLVSTQAGGGQSVSYVVC